MKANKDTIARTIVLALALTNQVLAIMGKGTFEFAEEEIYQLVSIVFTLGASAVAWWKNNSFSAEAKKGDELMKQLKAERSE